MKKLLASLLAMVMALSLAVPAFADGPDGPPTAESLGIIGGADGPTAIFTSTPVDGSYADALKTALGGVPGQIGVMINGDYVQFPDAVPEVTRGRTMVPVRAIVEALGGEASYDGREITCAMADRTVTFTLRSSEVQVEYTGGKLPGDAQVFPMDCAPYIKAGRTYVPVRFLGEVLGYDVGWDGEFQTAILLDRDALAAEIDKEFSILNKVQAANTLSLKDGESAKADLKGEIALTVASLEGNKTYKADFGISALMNDQALNGSATLNVSDALLELLLTQGGLGEDGREEAQAVLDALKKFEFILNKDGELWAHSDGLDSMAGEKNIWFGGSMDLGGSVDLSALLETGTQMSSVGAVAAAMADTGSVESWAVVKQMMAAMGLYSDDKFTISGGVSTLTIGLDELMGLYKDMGIDMGEALKEVKDVFKEYQITMKVDSKGAVTASCKVETNAVSGVPGIKMAMDAVQSGGEATVTMEISVAGMGKLEMTLTTAQKAAADKPMTEPPEGANIVDAPELFGGEGFSN